MPKPFMVEYLDPPWLFAWIGERPKGIYFNGGVLIKRETQKRFAIWLKSAAAYLDQKPLPRSAKGGEGER